MNIEHFTEKARQAISDAAQLARQYNHNQVEVEHLHCDLHPALLRKVREGLSHYQPGGFLGLIILKKEL